MEYLFSMELIGRLELPTSSLPRIEGLRPSAHALPTDEVPEISAFFGDADAAHNLCRKTERFPAARHYYIGQV